MAEDIGTTGREEAAYWLGMEIHRKRPRWVLTALRILPAEPKRRARAVAAHDLIAGRSG